MGASIPVSVVILTYNESLNLRPCIESVLSLASEVVVVDSGSDDGTQSIAQGLGARVIEHLFESHQAQWQWALEHGNIANEWVLGLDADQRVTAELAASLRRVFSRATDDLQFDGLYLNRRQIFRGKWIRFGGYYPKYLLKLFRLDRVFFDELDLMDHHFYVPGRTESLEGDLIEDNAKERDLKFWASKHLAYARLVAREEYERRQNRHGWPLEIDRRGSPDQHVMWLKQRWYELPLLVRPAVYFLYRYFFRLGFLDGWQGLIFHGFQGFWYRFLVDIHLSRLLSRRRREIESLFRQHPSSPR